MWGAFGQEPLDLTSLPVLCVICCASTQTIKFSLFILLPLHSVLTTDTISYSPESSVTVCIVLSVTLLLSLAVRLYVRIRLKNRICPDDILSILATVCSRP